MGRVDLRDAGMMQVSEQLGLDLEPALDGAGEELAAQHLERDDARGMLLVREVDDAGAAGADLADQR